MFIARKRWALVGLACVPLWCSAADYSFSDEPGLTLAQNSSTKRGVTTVSSSDEMDHSQHMGHDMGEEAHVNHGHGAGGWMLEYRFMRMYQEGQQAGSKPIAPEDVLAQAAEGKWVDADGMPITAVGTDMTMDMHMFMAMYSPTDNLTLMLMANYLANEMNMIMEPMDMGGGGMMPMAEHYDTMYMQSSGIGDTQIAMMYKLDSYLLYSPLLTLGVSLPTGSIDEADEMGMVMPYDMQLGSGTYDMLAAFGLSNMWENWHFGAEASYLYRMCENEQGYCLGDRWTLEGFLKYHLPTKTTLRTAVKHSDWDKISGRDERISDNPDYYGGMRADFWFGVSQELPWGFTVDAHYALPLHQKLNGVQMPVEWQMQFALGWMWM